MKSLEMKAFTLVELLVVVGIIAILAAILFPASAKAKAAAKGVACISQERQIGLGLALYAADNDDFLMTAGEEETSGPELSGESWLDSLQPYARTAEIYRCPEDRSPSWDALVDNRQTSYGLNAYFTPNHPPFYGFPLSSTVNASQCVLVGELADSVTEDHFSPMFWGDPAPSVDAAKNVTQWDSKTHLPRTIDLVRHLGGSNYLFVDLHAKKAVFDRLWHQTPGSLPTLNAFDPTR